MIGGDLKVDKYKYRARPQSLNFILFPPNHSLKPISFSSAIILLCKISLDTDPFFIYEDMFRCGIIETLLLITAVMVLINLSIHLFSRCWFYGTSYNYSEIWTSVFGSKKLSFIPLILNILSYMTYISWFNFEIYECASIFFQTVWPGCPSFICNKYFLMYFLNLITTFPCLFVTNFTSFTIIAYIGNIALIISTICLLILLIKSIKKMNFHISVTKFGSINDDEDSLPYLTYTTLFSKDASAFFGCIGTVMTAFYMHPFLEMIFANMQKPTVYRCLSSVWVTSFFSIIFFYGIGLISYFIVQIHLNESETLTGMMGPGKLKPDDPYFQTRPYSIFTIFMGHDILDLVNENILYNYPKEYIEAIIGQVASYAVTITSNIIYTYLVANQVSSLVIERNKNDIKPQVISGILVILFGIGINSLNGLAESFLDFISQISFLILVFVLPSIFYLKLFRFTKPFWGVISVVLLVIGLPMSVAVVYFSAIDL